MSILADLGYLLPLASAALWLFIGLGAFGRYGLASPFVRALTVFCLLIGGWALLDWYVLNFTHGGTDFLPTVLSNVRASLLAVASWVILLASKWINRGHSRYDALLVLPVLGSLAVVWSAVATGARAATWGPPLVADPVRYGLVVAQVATYFTLAILFSLSLVLGRTDLPSRLRTPALLSIGGLLVFVGLWLSTDVYANLTQPTGQPWFSSLLFIPALMSAVAFASRSEEEVGEIFRAVSAVERRVMGLYVFYRTGDPLIAVGASRTLPIEAEQLEGILDIVGNFVETSIRGFTGYTVTSMAFDRLGILAVRGQFVMVAAIFEGAAYDALRSELRRRMRNFEEAHLADLATWEGASRWADALADDLAGLLRRPQDTPASTRSSRR